MKNVAVLVCFCIVGVVYGNRPGGLSNEAPADAKVQRLVERHRNEIINLFPIGYYGRHFQLMNPFKAISYKTQVVAGTNYFIKIKTGRGRFAHVKIFDPLNGRKRVTDVQIGHSRNSPIRYF